MKIFKLSSMYLLLALIAFGYSADLEDQIQDLELRKANLRKDITDAEMKIQATDSLRKIEEERYLKLVERYQSDFGAREDDMKKLEAKLNEIKTLVRLESNKQNQYKSERKKMELQREQLVADLLQQCRNLEVAINSSLPWDLEKRLGRVSALRRDLETQNATLEEGFGRLKALVEDEIKFGDEIVVEARSMSRNDGTLVNATVLRIGNQWVVYVDDEEKNYGILQRNFESKNKWFEDLDFEQREAVRSAIAVKMAKKPPQVVDLPLDVLPKGGE